MPSWPCSSGVASTAMSSPRRRISYRIVMRTGRKYYEKMDSRAGVDEARAAFRRGFEGRSACTTGPTTRSDCASTSRI